MLFEIIMSILLEIVFPVIFEFIIIRFWDSIESSFKELKEVNKYVALAGCLMLGFVLGSISLLIYHHHIFTPNPLPGIGLIISPIAVGLIMKSIGDYRVKRGRKAAIITTFSGGALFAFAYTLLRFLFAR